MHLHFEKNADTKCDCSILSLSWMGKVPDNIPADDGWKLSRVNYYQEGWLATGNIRGIVGVTFTSSHYKKNIEFPQRTNFNLRGHRSEVILVKWNEPYQKLASCDSSGIIFVWIKYEGRWSIELINDRNCPVTHFSWSHDGRMALICYQDGFVLVGSVAGQRYWSSMLNLESTITCGIWTPDDQQVYFGTTQGQIIVMDVHGAMVSQVQLCSDIGITSMAWSCEKFKMEEDEDMEPGVSNATKRSFVLAVSFKNGFIYILKSFDDLAPTHINTGLNGSLGFIMEWSNSRELLAVAGTNQDATMSKNADPGVPQTFFENLLKFYTQTGVLLYTITIPSNTSPVSAMTWGHSDKRLFIATGTQVHIAWVSRRVASLQLLCRLQIQKCIGSEHSLSILPLPSKIKSLIGHLYAQTIRCCVPNANSLRDFVSRPPNGTRLHCTMIRHGEENNISSGTCYTLYLEYLGGLVPLLKGKRTSKIRPEFVIFDPQHSADTDNAFSIAGSVSAKSSSGGSNHSAMARSDSSESEDDLDKESPRPTRKRKTKTKCRNNSSSDKSSSVGDTNDTPDELNYIDSLPEEIKLVEVNSNIWGTKFKIHGIAKNLPANLGQISYKTSLLHLQPRQMTVVVTELRDDVHNDPDPNFNPHIFSEDEDEPIVLNVPTTSVATRTKNTTNSQPQDIISEPAVVSMSPQSTRSRANSKSSQSNSSQIATKANMLGMLAKAESYEDELPVCDKTSDTQNHIRPKNIEPISSSSSRAGPSYTSLVTQYSRSSSNSSGQSRHAISPLCCEGSVPTLQSPKNAVAPSDIIFDRPPATHTSLINYSGNNDCSGNIMQVKSNVVCADSSKSSSAAAVPKKRDLMQFIDDDNVTSVTIENPTMTRTPTIVSISPTSITRSCSVGYLDSVDIVPSAISLSILRKENPYKRLVLVDRKPSARRDRKISRKRLVQCGKSKSLDSYDMQQIFSAADKPDAPMPKVHETSETDDSASDIAECDSADESLLIPTAVSFKKIGSSKLNSNNVCFKCKKLVKECNCKSSNRNVQKKIGKLFAGPSSSGGESSKAEGVGKKSISTEKTKCKNKSEIITSYADSPLFTRKHRFGDNGSAATGSESSKKADYSFSFLMKQLSESRRRKRDEHNQQAKVEREVHQQIEVEPDDRSNNISLQAQALTTLENIISRLNTPGSPSKSQRQPRSSPASPSVSKKGKRHQSSSPIRQILNSPILNRRNRKKQLVESSDEETNSTQQDDSKLIASGKQHNYQDLETFQKAQLRQKLKRGKVEPNGVPSISQPVIMRREFVMHNRAPMWNENSQVYQLDFGGRVTQESAKNFQIEFRGQQVMQFGRIDGNAYTLDFQYPFSALQAFSVALANVTQRLK